MAWRLEKDLPEPFSETIKIGMVFIDGNIPVVKQFKGTHFFEVGAVEYVNEILPTIYNLPPGTIRNYYLSSFVKAIKEIQ